MRNRTSNLAKQSYLLVAVGLGLWSGSLMGHAADEQKQVASPASIETKSTPNHFGKLTTVDGKIYEDVTVQKIQPDGLLVEFSIPGGGFGTAKIKFRNLPATVREQYPYDPRQAEAFEASQAEGERAWKARNEAWAERREAALAEQMAREQRLRDQASAQESSRQAAEQARSDQQQPASQPPVYGWPWVWTGGWNSRPHHLPHRINQSAPAPPVSPFIGPMRPLGK